MLSENSNKPSQPTNSSKKNFTSGLDAAWSAIGGRWKLHILWQLRPGSTRYTDLRDRVPNISDRMLSQSLKELEQSKLVLRTIYPEVPPRVEYRLSHDGIGLLPILEKFNEWGLKRILATTKNTLRPGTTENKVPEWS